MNTKKVCALVFALILTSSPTASGNTLNELEYQYDQLRQSFESDVYLLNVTLRGYEADAAQCILRYTGATDPISIMFRNDCQAAFDSTQQSIFDVTRRAGNTSTQMNNLRVQIDALKAATPTTTSAPTPTSTSAPTPTTTSAPTPTSTSAPTPTTTSAPTPTTTSAPTPTTTSAPTPTTTSAPTPTTTSAPTPTTTSAPTPTSTSAPSTSSSQTNQKLNNFAVLNSNSGPGSSLVQFSTNQVNKVFRVVANKKNARTIRMNVTSTDKGVIEVRSKIDLTGYRLTISQNGRVVNRHLVENR